MPIVTDIDNWRIPIVIIWLFLMIKGGRKGRVAALLIIPVLVLGDQIAAFVLKPWIGRLRPCHALENVRLLVNCGGKNAFPSNHATNISGFAIIFGLIYRQRWHWFLALALIIGFSRIYIGVHYPLDVIGGFFLEGTIGLAIFILYTNIAMRFPSIHYLENSHVKEEVTDDT